VYGNFAVWALRDRQEIWTDGSESSLLARVSTSVRLKVLRREAAHYVVRLPDMRQGYVAVDAVAAAPASAASAMLRRETPQHTGVAADFVRASYFTRIMAKVIDSITLWIAFGVIAGVAIAAAPSSDAGEGAGTSVAVGAAVSAALFGMGFLYEWVGTASGGTLGKAWLNISVVDAATGRAPGLGKSFVRYGAGYVVNAVLGFGMLWLVLGAAVFAPGQIPLAFGIAGAVFLSPYLVAFATDGRTLYDLIAGTWVVQYR
jgi:uncharacterized RDD family membrane protein YckC